MKAEIDKKDEKALATIDLEIPAEQASQEYNKACRRLGQRINIPGFRRGKAPRAVIEKTVGIDKIKQEALDRLLPPAFADVISEHQLDIVAPPQIEKFNFDLKEGIKVKAQVELRPEVKLPKLTKLDVDVPEFKPEPDALENELNALVERSTTLEPVIDRPAKDTDIVDIDFDGFIGEEAIKGGSAQNYRLDLANNNFIEGFASQIPGHKISDEFTINVKFPDDYYDTTLKGKDATFKVKLNDIKEKKIPELTDDFARKLNEDFESIDDLKKNIQKLLDEHTENENTFRKQKALVDKVVEMANITIPEPMVNREANLLQDEVKNRLKSQGMSWEQFVESQGKENVWNNLRSEARQRIKTSLVFGAIAKDEGVVVSEEEFSAQVREVAAMSNADEKAIMKQLANNLNAAQAMNDQILSQKIVTMLMERANFKFVEDTSANEQEAPATSPTDNETSVAKAIEGEEFDVIEEEKQAEEAKS